MAKLTITFKSPDTVWDALEDAGIDPNEDNEFSTVLSRYVEYDEYVRIELDSETGEAIVLPN